MTRRLSPSHQSGAADLFSWQYGKESLWFGNLCSIKSCMMWSKIEQVLITSTFPSFLFKVEVSKTCLLIAQEVNWCIIFGNEYKIGRADLFHLWRPLGKLTYGLWQWWMLVAYTTCRFYFIMQAQTPVLFYDYLRTKRNNPEFNVAMGAYDSAEAWNIAGILLQWCLRFMFNIKDTGLYRDDGLILLWKTSPHNRDWLRKELRKFYKNHDLNITTTDIKVIHFQNVTLDRDNDYHRPYAKELHNNK